MGTLFHVIRCYHWVLTWLRNKALFYFLCNFLVTNQIVLKHSMANHVAELLRALFLNHSIISPLCLAIRETSQILLAGVPGGFSRGSPVFTPPTDWPVSYELK